MMLITSYKYHRYNLSTVNIHKKLPLQLLVYDLLLVVLIGRADETTQTEDDGCILVCERTQDTDIAVIADVMEMTSSCATTDELSKK